MSKTKNIDLNEYFGKLSQWCTYDKYESLYGGIDYKGKTVIDWGADCGSTAVWFLQHGASHVICIERNKSLIKTFYDKVNVDLKSIIKNRIVYCENLDGALTFEADVLKMDIERGEFKIPLSYFNKFKEFVVGLHPEYRATDESDKLFLDYTNYIIGLGAKLKVTESCAYVVNNIMDHTYYGEFVWEKSLKIK